MGVASAVSLLLGSNSAELEILGVVNTHRARAVGSPLLGVEVVALAVSKDRELVDGARASRGKGHHVAPVVKRLGVPAGARGGLGFAEVSNGGVVFDCSVQGAIVLGSCLASVGLLRDG